MLYLRNLSLVMLLFAAVLIANAPILSHDVMYHEQATLYLVNQSIHSLGDLVNVYLHPKGLDDVIPFFRPSGHFLMYQLLTPFIGWHNTRALIVVNLLFLAATGWVMIRLYQVLFPQQKMGGYLAFAIYLVHPSLILSRFLEMHFEFAHVFFLLLGLYYFVLFCQKNQAAVFRHFSLCCGALISFVIAVTFKESAIMLGPVMMLYFVLHFQRQSFSKQGGQLLLLLLVTTVTLAIYLTLPWPHLDHPFKHQLTIMERLAVLNQFFKNFFGIHFNLITHTALPSGNGESWRHVIFPPVFRVLFIGFFLAGVLHALQIFFSKHNAVEKKSLLFLLLAAVFFLAIPFQWGMALPWHWNLSILFLSLFIGAGLEAFICKIKSAMVFSSVLFFVLIMLGIEINEVNINDVLRLDPAMVFNREAIFHPPVIRQQLNQNSIIVVPTHLNQDPYSFGNASANYLAIKNFDYDKARKKLAWLYRQYDPYYNGTLFKWAYLMPELREEVFPFSLNKMDDVPNEVIYRWLENENNIFCFALDEHSRWYDATAEFRANLLHERDQRHLVISAYDVHYVERLKGQVFTRVLLPYPDSKLCQYSCAQNAICKGFTYMHAEDARRSIMGCEFYSDNPSRGAFCASCEGFIKT